MAQLTHSKGRRWIAVAGLLGALGVALGAFGAHALPTYLQHLGLDAQEVTRRTSLLETGVRYQLWHVLAILIVGIAMRDLSSRWWNAAGIFFTLGVLLFSGSLYAIVLTGNGRWGMITPLGGVSFLLGWMAILAASRSADAA